MIREIFKPEDWVEVKQPGRTFIGRVKFVSGRYAKVYWFAPLRQEGIFRLDQLQKIEKKKGD